MLKLLGAIAATILTDLYIFPLGVFGGINSKMILAAVGIAAYLYERVNIRGAKIEKSLFMLLLLAVLVSFAGVISVIVNNSSDYSYATYIISAVTWLGGAYGLCFLIKGLHGECTLEMMCYYFIAVCLVQCVLAQFIDSVPAVAEFVDRYFDFGQQFMKDKHRLYGIGAALDTAGIRFAVALVLITFLISSNAESNKNFIVPLGIVSFFTVLLLGCMIARTTMAGALLGIIYMLTTKRLRGNAQYKKSILLWALLLSSVGIIICTILYKTNSSFYEHIRFAFEGFFNLFETGEYQVDSTDKLKTMVVFPDNFKTWIIGDGYFGNPDRINPYYIGEVFYGNFYMATDVGYLRFIFYFGLIGLLMFAAFIFYSFTYASAKFPDCQWMFFLILILNFIIWAKVATDIFFVFAIFISCNRLAQKREDETPV